MEWAEQEGPAEQRYTRVATKGVRVAMERTAQTASAVASALPAERLASLTLRLTVTVRSAVQEVLSGPGYYQGYPTIGGASGAPGSAGISQGDSIGVSGGQLVLKNSLLATAASGTNVVGVILDAGNNLNSDSTDSLTNGTSLNGINPQLGTLGYCGGPTPTVPLLAGSPAIDAADLARILQRGTARGDAALWNGAGIGAFEYCASYLVSGTVSGLTPATAVFITAGQ